MTIFTYSVDTICVFYLSVASAGISWRDLEANGSIFDDFAEIIFSAKNIDLKKWVGFKEHDFLTKRGQN